MENCSNFALSFGQWQMKLKTRNEFSNLKTNKKLWQIISQH
jgi:hypothetical protein